MPSTAFTSNGSLSSEAEIARRAEEQRIQRILEPKDDEARQRWRAARNTIERQQAQAEERAKTELYARGLLWSVLGTVLLALATTLWDVVA